MSKIGSEEVEVAMPLVLRDTIASIASAIDEKVDIPVIGDVQEKEIFEDAVRTVVNAAVALLPPSLLKAFSDESSGLEQGYIDSIVAKMADEIAQRVKLPYLNLSDEQEASLIGKICKALMRFAAEGESLNALSASR